MSPSFSAGPEAGPPAVAAVFFSREIIWLTPGDLGRFQSQRRSFAAGSGSGRAFRLQPLILTIGALERALLAEMPWPEMDELAYRLLLHDLAGPLADLLTPAPAGPAEDEARLKIRSALAGDLGDGLGRLKLAGLTWDQVAELPPPELARTLAGLGRRHDDFLKARGCLDRAAKRRRLLDELRAGRLFKTLAGTRRIVYRGAGRLSPFETEFLLALAAAVRVEVTLTVPAWVREESPGAGAGFDLLRSIRRLEASPAAGLTLEFGGGEDETVPAALAYAAEALLAPAAWLQSRPPAPEPGGSLRLVRTPTAYHEVEEASRRLKKLLAGGRSPEEMALVVPSLEDYGPLVDDVGRRFGLAFHFRRGPTLADRGPARAALDLLSLWGSQWERSRLLELIRNPYFRLLGQHSPSDLGRLALTAGVTDRRAGGGFEENLAKLLRAPGGRDQAPAARALLGLIGRLKSAGRDMEAAADWPGLLGRFRSLLDQLGWPGAAGETGGPPETADRDRAAAAGFREELDRLERAMRDGPAPPAGLAWLRLWLKDVLAERRLSDGRGPDGRVWVLNYYDLHGGRFEEIFFLGLNERVFPRTGPESRWWPREFVSAAAGRDFLGRSLWSDAADRYRQEELLLAAGLGQARRRVWLFHHAGDEAGRPALPSPLLTALRDLWPDGRGGSRLPAETTAWRAAPDPAEAAGPDELWVGLARLDPADWPASAPRTESGLRLWRALRRRRDLWRQMRRAARPGPAEVARWLAARPGHLGAPLLRPSFLAGFADCPLAFWFREALRLVSDGEPLEEWPPSGEGDFLHRVMEKFFRRRLGSGGRPGPPWPGAADEAACAEELRLLARAEDALAEECPVGRRPLWQIRRAAVASLLNGWLRRELAAGGEADEARPWFLEWSFGAGPRDQAPPLALAVDGGETIYFHGRVDRLDRTARGLRVRDYKRRDDPAGFRVAADGRRVPPRSWPLLVYTLAAGAHFGLPAESSFEILDPGAERPRRPGLSSDHPALNPSLAARARLKEEGGESFTQLLAETWAAVRAGAFAPAGGGACRYCPFPALCPRAEAEDDQDEASS